MYIREAIKEYHSTTLLGLYFNLSDANNAVMSIGARIKDDGESIQSLTFQKFLTKEYLQGESYTENAYINIELGTLNDDLCRFIGEKLIEIQFGEGRSDVELQDVLYYFRLKTSNNNLMFFNNGDEGAIIMDATMDVVLQHDIHNVRWSRNNTFFA